MGLYTPTYEHIIIEGSYFSIKWIRDFLIENDIFYCLDRDESGNMVRISFVQECYEREETPLQKIVRMCTSTAWEVVEQFKCNYSTILDA